MVYEKKFQTIVQVNLEIPVFMTTDISKVGCRNFAPKLLQSSYVHIAMTSL